GSCDKFRVEIIACPLRLTPKSSSGAGRLTLKPGKPECRPRLLQRLGSLMLPPGEHEVNRPTTANVRTRPAQVRLEVGAGAARFFQGIGQDGKEAPVQFAAGEVALVVGGPGEGRDRGCQPGRVAGDGAEGVAEDFTQEGS